MNPPVRQTLDLRGVPCPMNFVQTKLALEEMEAGEVVEVWLDRGEAEDSVPRSAAEENHRVVGREDAGDHVRIRIEKG